MLKRKRVRIDKMLAAPYLDVVRHDDDWVGTGDCPEYGLEVRRTSGQDHLHR